MIKERPDGCNDYLKPLQDADMMSIVLLKKLDYYTQGNYIVRPGQHYPNRKCMSTICKQALCFMRVLKKVLKIDISNYLAKKLLLRPVDCPTGYGFDEYFYQLMCLPEFKMDFASSIDYEKGKRKQDKFYISIRKCDKKNIRS
jgi:hypothetical protein